MPMRLRLWPRPTHLQQVDGSWKCVASVVRIEGGMMKGMGLLVCGALVSLVLVGCGQGQPPVDAATTSGSVKDDASAKATLQVVPGTVDSCEVGATIDPVVSWERIDPAVKNTKVTVDSPANPEPKLFSEAGFKGNASAGNWVVVGTRFRLFDQDTGVELASYTVTTTKPCTK